MTHLEYEPDIGTVVIDLESGLRMVYSHVYLVYDGSGITPEVMAEKHLDIMVRRGEHAI